MTIAFWRLFIQYIFALHYKLWVYIDKISRRDIFSSIILMIHVSGMYLHVGNI